MYENLVKHNEVMNWKPTRSWVENECCCPRSANISNVNFTTNQWDSKCPALIAQMVVAVGMYPKVGFESPLGRNIFFLKNFDTFTRRSACESKMNAVARAQLKFQKLTLLQIYRYHRAILSVTNPIHIFRLAFNVCNCSVCLLPKKLPTEVFVAHFFFWMGHFDM